MKALIDGDIVAYRIAATTENEPEEIAKIRIDTFISDILINTEVDQYKVFLSGHNNFRKDINDKYKANRKDLVKPSKLDLCKEYLVTEHGGIVTDGYEADDALGFNQTEDTIICSIDKDLLMIPGKHYNFVKREFTEIHPIQGLQNFYKQMLIGDSTDNIFGVAGLGKVKSAKLIDPLVEEKDMYLTVCNLYKDTERFDMNADCLWIWRNEYERFTDRQPCVD